MSSMFALDEICAAHTAQRTRLMQRRRLIVLHAMIAALRRDREDLIQQRRALLRLRPALEEPLVRVSRWDA
jgi:hypothetical protein